MASGASDVIHVSVGQDVQLPVGDDVMDQSGLVNSGASVQQAERDAVVHPLCEMLR